MAKSDGCVEKSSLRCLRNDSASTDTLTLRSWCHRAVTHSRDSRFVTSTENGEDAYPMKVLLSQATERGEVAIGRTANGVFHVVWCGESLATADTLGGALMRASEGPLRRPSDGTDLFSSAHQQRIRRLVLALCARCRDACFDASTSRMSGPLGAAAAPRAASVRFSGTTISGGTGMRESSSWRPPLGRSIGACFTGLSQVSYTNIKLFI
jgi:hypothetical protein